MGKILAGMLLVLLVPLGFASNAGAAEIPPTTECVKTFKKLIREYSRTVPDDASNADIRKADRKLARSLARADCISAAKPLLKKMKIRPFTRKCRSGAKAANEYWKPLTRRLDSLARNRKARLTPLERRIERVEKRIRKLRLRGASQRRIKSLVRIRKSLKRKHERIDRRFSKRALRVVAPRSYATTLIVFEFASRRCVSFERAFGKTRGPARKAVRKNNNVVLLSILNVGSRAEGNLPMR